MDMGAREVGTQPRCQEGLLELMMEELWAESSLMSQCQPGEGAAGMGGEGWEGHQAQVMVQLEKI